MEFANLLNIRSRAEFREWLMQNHRTQAECWVEVKRGRPVDDETFWYVDAVEEALCFGWIDSTVKRLPDNRTVQRFSRRRARSKWSELNKERCRMLERNGQMTDAGREVLPEMGDDGFVIDDDILRALQSEAVVWDKFMSFPELYRRVRINTVQITKSRPELFEARLRKLIDNTRRGIMYGEWNDYGRLG